jgi:S-(hydroxymethyl)glutathione dehydrogenase/alcohol dehydrogenase
MMFDTMKAVVFSGVDQPLKIEQLRLPEPHEGEVLVKVSACGVCHTDLHVMLGEVNFPSPAVLGHEITGIVTKLGPGVKNIKEGTRVAS